MTERTAPDAREEDDRPVRLRSVPEPAGHRRLREIAEQLEQTGWAFEVVDADWSYVWASEQLKTIVGESDDAAFGIGQHVLVTRGLPVWDATMAPHDEHAWGKANIPYMLHRDPGALRLLADDALREQLGDLEPVPPPATWAFSIRFARPGESAIRVSCVGFTLHEHGETLGYAIVYGPSLPASLLALVVRGDERQFGRMARRFEPRHTPAAILFADLEASTAVSRRVPSRAFFAFIRALATAMDHEVLARNGIVGKHAGDGVTAFFAVEDLGSPAAAASAAIEAARAMAGAAAEVVSEIPAVAEVLADSGCQLNAGLHWGPGLYMGQLVTGGRLEVTALGDEVNECARIEQAARGGALLASKTLVEQLGDDDARRLGLSPAEIVYRVVADLPGAGEKSRRDAGGNPVADLAAQLS